MAFPGTDLKFRITAQSRLADLQEQAFAVTVRDAYRRTVLSLEKDDCFRDADGRFYFTLENPRRGRYYAYFETAVEDEDYLKHERMLRDGCLLVEVGTCGCGTPRQCGCHLVSYEQVWTADVDGTPYLVGRDGEYILTSDGRRIPFLSAG